jgi:hypothetical protein
MFETNDVYNQKGEKFIEYPENFDGINNLIAVKNGIFISTWGNKGIKFFDH